MGSSPISGKFCSAFLCFGPRPRVRAPYRELGNLKSSSLLSVRLVLPDGEPEIGSLRLRSPSIVGCFLFPAASRRMHLRNSSQGFSLAPSSWPRCTLPAEDLYLSNSVFPLETIIFLERFPLERESFLFPAHVPLQLCGRLGAPLTRHHNS